MFIYIITTINFRHKINEVVKLKANRFAKKLTGIFLALVILAMTLTPACFAVTYPEGVTPEKAKQTMTKFDVVMHTLAQNAEGKSLYDLISPMIFCDSTMSALTKTLYSMSEENADTFSVIGLPTKPAEIAPYLTAYPAVQARLLSAASWSAVSLDGAEWGIKTTEDFVRAAVALFTPMNELMYTLLCGGSYSLNPLVGIQGAKGYENAVVQIFIQFGMDSYTAPSTFTAQAQQDKSTMVQNLIYDIADYLKQICSAPATMLSTKLPYIAYFIENGGLDNAISILVEPLKIKILGITTPIKIGSVMSLAQQGETGTSVDFDIDIGSFSASGTLQTAPFDMAELSSFVTYNGEGYTVNSADSFIYILRWIIETLRLNIGSIPQMLSEMDLGMTPAEISQILTGLFQKSTDELMATLINLLTATGGTVNPYVWTFNQITPITVNYTPNLTQDKYKRVLDGIDALITEFIKEGGEADSIRAAAAPMIYSNNVMTELVVGIYGLLEDERLSELTTLAGIDFSPAALGNRLTEESYSAVSSALRSITKFSLLKQINTSWGFKDGDRDAFIRTVSAVFRPMESLLRMVLCGEGMTVLGAVSLYGSDGYNTAVIPLLEAIGCTFEEIRTYDEIKEEIKQTDVMFPIVQAVVTLIERMLEYPVYTLTGILPNLMYFINNGGIEICINNLLYPVTSLVDSLGLSGQINLEAVKEKIDTEKLMDDMISKIDLGIILPELDLKQFGSIGYLIPVQTKRTQQGQPMTIQYLQSDRTAVLITLLRYMVEIMKTPGNEGIIDSFMASNGDNEMFANYSSGITEELAAMSVDETIEWLYKLFFRERATVEEPEEDYTPDIIYKENNSFSGTTVIICLLVLAAAAGVIGWLNKEKIKELIAKIKERKGSEV